MQLSNSKLLKPHAYIDGKWSDAESGNTFPVNDPATGEELATVPDLGRAETEKAVAAAKAAFPAWSKKTAGERSAILRRWYELMLENVDDLAMILTSEQGKPLAEAAGEIRYGASFVEWFAEEGKRAYGDVIPGHGTDKRITVIKQPVGVVAAITPWNFPNAMITRKVAPALAVGCTVVIKPAEATPLSALALAHLAGEAGFPPGVLNIITTNTPKEVGAVLTESEVVRKLSFTGSTAVGKELMRQCAGTVKKLSLELGGNAPFIVFNDADIAGAVAGAVASKYRNAGQTCVCSNRIYVQAGVYDKFVKDLKKAVDELRVGDGRQDGVDIGPLINQAGLDKVEALVADAKEKGARVLAGGKRSEQGDLFYEPTILADADQNMDVASTEIFGPVAPVFKFETEEEVIRMANDTPFGLAAYFYGRDYALIWRVAEALEYGMVGINTGMISTAIAPFGGIKESGFGREGSKYGLEDYLETKYMCWGGVE
ncbi:NAD-dependent succinate-semialdehyde dehydrogenase [Neolewinella aurantiaca]|uniref:NAD-dependent succinate-semialdehyde dehydrogenase n=1 Tax=Neolewinella aurantiaca TaxID=2602767 RepID=A0A5C7FUP1_9BACT|nr:NAD-dependent succinate-semialdehyde dehydrogenase [Neolewinella aurantiaca]TXF90307.1 NAD-dependent succinate-semialdehyde dehydrogenase [Neolewinella aurantiaca]